MVAPIIGAAISAGGSLLGGFLNNKAASDESQKNWDRQKTAMKNQIQWKVQDAEKAGIHPLAALGVNPASAPGAAQVFDNGIGNAASALGEAVERSMDPMQKGALAMQRIQLERGTLDNELVRGQIASQRMKNIQQSTPGVVSTTGNNVLVNPLTDKPFPAKYPNLGQDAENAYSDIGGNAFGAANLISDLLRNNGYDPAQAYADPIGYGTTELRKATSAAWDRMMRDPNPDYANPPVFNWGY